MRCPCHANSVFRKNVELLPVVDASEGLPANCLGVPDDSAGSYDVLAVPRNEPLQVVLFSLSFPRSPRKVVILRVVVIIGKSRPTPSADQIFIFSPPPPDRLRRVVGVITTTHDVLVDKELGFGWCPSFHSPRLGRDRYLDFGPDRFTSLTDSILPFGSWADSSRRPSRTAFRAGVPSLVVDGSQSAGVPAGVRGGCFDFTRDPLESCRSPSAGSRGSPARHPR